VSVHKAGLTDTGLIPAAALTLPIMLFFPLTVIGDYCQFPELFSDPVLQRRTAQAPAAAPVTVYQLTGRHKDFVPAVTDAVPQYAAVRIPFPCHREDLQLSESSACQIFIAGLFSLAPAGSHPAVFKKAGRCVHSITAVTSAKPYCISVLPLSRRFECSQLAESPACEITLSAHVYIFFPADRFQGVHIARKEKKRLT